jgi:hypothetical protein
MKRPKPFSYEEATALLPLIRQITADAVDSLTSLLEKGEDFDGSDIPPEIAAEYQKLTTQWASRVIELGVEVKGLWLVDFDSGSGYYCWKHPEPALEYFHSYEEGFSGRVKLN